MREYFRNIRQNRIKLRMAQKRLRDMQENMAAISSPDLSGMPKGSRSAGDAYMAHDVSEILEQEKYIDILKSRTARESIKAEKIIRSLKNPVEAAVLFARYIDIKEWNDIVKFIYSDKKDLDYNFEKYKKRVYRAHKKAFEHLEERKEQVHNE